MDNLRSVLCILFNNQNGSEIVDSVNKHYSCKRMDTFIDSDLFCRLFRERYNIYSYDQIFTIYGILTSNWMSEFNDSLMRSYSRNSVFNVLLHFSTEILVERENLPVCKYHQLFRWHLLAADLGEDIFTTSFFAAKDIALGTKRNIFSWNHCIDHDNSVINHILNKPIADLHFHLKGSSINFDLNWLSLMNSIKMRKNDFEVLQKLQNPSMTLIDNGKIADDLYTSTTKACLIRYTLFRKLTNNLTNTEEDKIWYLLKSGNSWHDIITYLEPKLSAIKYLHGKTYKGHLIDYAIPDILTFNELTDQNKYHNSILSGERWLMYEMFRRIYSADENNERYATLFYAYLVNKTQLRHELIQLNQKIGFTNFSQYENRKELFIKKGTIYQTLIVHLAIHNSIKNRENNYVEARITPKNSTIELSKSINETDNNIFDNSFLSPNNINYGINRTNYHYILHFIKEKDIISNNSISNLTPRNYNLRVRVRNQTIAIANIRSHVNKYAHRVVGIDAANTEIGCRPEVFAQAFRYLKFQPHKQKFEYILNTTQRQLGFTYHIGEDYMDVADGLRAIDEAIRFLNLTDGDRIGHALALGIDIEKYYIKENYTIVMPIQNFLDNIVWIWEQIKNLQIIESYPLLYQLEQWYEVCFREVFGVRSNLFTNGSIPSIYSYYQSWLLRGDNPFSYLNFKNQFNLLLIGYDQYAFNRYSKEIIDARQSRDARMLYHLYHFDKSVKINGAKSGQWKIDKMYQFTIQEIQNQMCKNIERKHISIETNPTSNFRIGSLVKYEYHPITRFYNYGIDTLHLPSQIPVSINTDDLGVFNTSIEREFSLIALALEKNTTAINNPRCIYDWIDRIREMAFEQRFFKR